MIGTIWGLRKTANDIEELNTYLFDCGYSCLKSKEWDLAEYIYSMLLTDEKQQLGADRMYEQINLWIAKKNKYGIEPIRDDVSALDVSAMKTQFDVAKHALLDEFDMVSQLLDEIIDKELPAWCITDWPLLDQYRNSDQYSVFKDKHKELFEVYGYESSNEIIGDAEDVMNELGEDIDVEYELEA